MYNGIWVFYLKFPLTIPFPVALALTTVLLGTPSDIVKNKSKLEEHPR